MSLETIVARTRMSPSSLGTRPIRPRLHRMGTRPELSHTCLRRRNVALTIISVERSRDLLAVNWQCNGSYSYL